ncbi:energy-coupling factor ABC transporter permease [endosymbiont of Ridgeia piscesae]|jgi:uncharacterized membrane protein|uniref:Putative membrane protein n=1 Tax=endosymbiont of Ridgeia piscesae TaxID=54398 RepID=A0A0T5Z666_9GAMM|nr:energy-coupling factor ABC transporter permease [endosymbiont of Ridgeia piscesae]KRT54161.1 putative membrane protein [endosymbiont of Ridgeia piscesae]KRT58410.1 putative membrane protein [endosymbiont of Ridgeia piscesae]
MELDGALFPAEMLWWLGAFYGMALLAALRMAPWRRLFAPSQLHVFLGAIVALIALWHMRGQVLPGVTFHLLGVTTVTLMFGWSFALLVASVVLLVVSWNVGYGWQGLLLSGFTTGLLPITLTQVLLVLVRSWLPKNFFIYVLGSGFLTAWLVAYISGYLAVWLLVTAGVYTYAKLQVTIMPFFPLMFFPEALVNGWIVTILVSFCPAWVYSFSDEQYLKGK